MLAYESKYFFKNDLAYIVQKCKVDNNLINTGIVIGFDEANGFGKYKGSTIEHEAAYDAYITGFCIPYILRHMDNWKADKEEEK